MSNGLSNTDELNVPLCTFKYPVCAVYRVWPTVTGPPGEDAGLHHHTWQSGTGTGSVPGPASYRTQSATAGATQHPGHHHHHYNHGSQDHHYYKTNTKHLQKGCACKFVVEN